MAIVTEYTATIDGLKFEGRTLTASQSMDIMPDLATVAGSDILALLASAESEGRLDEVLSDGSNILALVVAALRNASKVEGGLSAFAKRLLGNVSVTQEDGTKLSCASSFDDVFTGKMQTLAKVLLDTVRRSFS